MYICMYAYASAVVKSTSKSKPATSSVSTGTFFKLARSSIDGGGLQDPQSSVFQVNMILTIARTHHLMLQPQ